MTEEVKLRLDPSVQYDLSDIAHDVRGIAEKEPGDSGDVIEQISFTATKVVDDLTTALDRNGDAIAEKLDAMAASNEEDASNAFQMLTAINNNLVIMVQQLSRLSGLG